MKTLLNIIKWVIISVLSLIVLVVSGLLIFYQTQYKDTPLPSQDKIIFQTSHLDSDNHKPLLYPIPRKVEWTNGYFILSPRISFNGPKEDRSTIKALLQSRLGVSATENTAGNIQFIKNSQLGSQAYNLSVSSQSIRVEYGDLQGLFYSLTTLKQLARQSFNHIPCVNINDKPDLQTRGAMLDISRGKVPNLETLYKMVDFLSDVKYNHLELYIEGFSFAYPSFKNLWIKDLTPFTSEEFRKLDAYCKERFIELVPNQNSLGHMNAWLATPDYKDLAECPEGYKFLGILDMKSTLAPKNPKSIQLVEKMANDLLPNFSSDKFNVDMDEPFELGKNKDHPIQDPKEVTRIYLDYAKRLDTFVKSKGKRMLMWGDVISRNPEFASEIPKDITLLEWRYEAFQDFSKICRKYQNAKLDFMVCPGTSSWSSYTGRTDNMLANIQNAVSNGIQFGAKGMINTDWGDTPHLQYLTVSYPGLAFGGALSWNNSPDTKKLLGDYLSRIIFQDSTNRVGDIFLNLGRYSQFEEFPMVSGTMTSFGYRFGIMDKMMTDAIFKKFQQGISELVPSEGEGKKTLFEQFNHPRVYNYSVIKHWVDSLEMDLGETRLKCPDKTLILDEYKNAIRMIKLGADLKEYNNYHLQRSDSENKNLLTEMKTLCQTILNEHKRLWMSRNKPGGYETSTDSFIKLQGQVDENLALLNQNGLVRGLNRTKEKLITAAAVLFLK